MEMWNKKGKELKGGGVVGRFGIGEREDNVVLRCHRNKKRASQSSS